MEKIQEIAKTNLPEIEKLAQAFRHVTDFYLQDGDRELELLKVLGDQTNLVKTQIKLSTIQHAQSIFAQCYLMVTGRKAWDE